MPSVQHVRVIRHVVATLDRLGDRDLSDVVVPSPLGIRGSKTEYIRSSLRQITLCVREPTAKAHSWSKIKKMEIIIQH